MSPTFLLMDYVQILLLCERKMKFNFSDFFNYDARALKKNRTQRIPK